MTETERAAPWARRFFTIWIGQALSLVGSRVGGFALVWWLTRTTESAQVLATATLVAMIPHALLAPVIGALVDRWDRRRVMLVADGLVALFSAVLAILAWQEVLAVWQIYVIMFIRALGGMFHWAAMQASTSLMVPKEQLARVGGMNQTLQGVLGIVTPPLGALLMEVLPLHTIMGIDVVTAAFAIGPLFFVAIPQPQVQPEEAERGLVRPVLRDVKAGFRYLWNWEGMFAVLITSTLINMVLNPAGSLQPLLVKSYFGGDALELGWMNSAWGGGVVLGGLLLSIWGGFRSKIFTSLAGLVGMGVGFALLGIAPANAFWLALVSTFIAGFMNPITNAPMFAIIQEVVAPELQGRVFTTIISAGSLASLLSLAVAGPLADLLGVQFFYVIGGALCILLALGLRLNPAVMRLEEHGQFSGEESAPGEEGTVADAAPAGG